VTNWSDSSHGQCVTALASAWDRRELCRAMCRGTAKCERGFAKDLPEDCPPQIATAATDGFVVYRTVVQHPPTAFDFTSQRERFPNKVFGGITECRTRAVSTHINQERCAALLTTPLYANGGVVAVTLTPECGALEIAKGGHVALWACAAFDPISASRRV
jgi:hypothetical protein